MSFPNAKLFLSLYNIQQQLQRKIEDEKNIISLAMTSRDRNESLAKTTAFLFASKMVLQELNEL